MPISPAGRDRAARTDRALDDDRRRTGNDRNRDQADSQTAPALSDEASLALPNNNQRKVAGR
jgi:hypothetical protein